MQYFIFRNMTVERLFANLDAEFSGYGDISIVPDCERYVWFYMAPNQSDKNKSADEIYSYVEMFKLALDQISTKTVIALTMRGIYDADAVTSNHTEYDAIVNYNNVLYSLAETYSNLKIVNFASFTEAYPASELIDWKYYFISQMALNPRLAIPFKKWFASQLSAIELKRKKCLILDLDNTLWGGILGEDGIDGVKLGGDYPGKAFLMFQKHIAVLGKQGVMLAVCSKNNLADVQEMWLKHPDCVLKEDSFTILKINWQNKADNIRQMADELNIGLDSMVFVDDNPTERELIKTTIPEVVVPVFPEQPYSLPIFFKELVAKYFTVYSLTKEDLDKTAQYKANALRNTIRSQFTNMDDYLRNLEIVLKIEEINDITIPRIAQMTQKTNQFNLTTRRYTDADVKRFAVSGYKIYTIAVSDKFGDNGITGTCIVKIDGMFANIDLLLLSCRILGKGIEQAFVAYILKQLKSVGVTQIEAEYIPTTKNSQVADFYDKNGFTLTNINANGIKTYSLLLDTTDIALPNKYRYI